MLLLMASYIISSYIISANRIVCVHEAKNHFVSALGISISLPLLGFIPNMSPFASKPLDLNSRNDQSGSKQNSVNQRTEHSEFGVATPDTGEIRCDKMKTSLQMEPVEAFHLVQQQIFRQFPTPSHLEAPCGL